MPKSISILLSTLKAAFSAFLDTLRFTITSDDGVMSEEGRKILSNPKDKAAYLKAIEELRSKDEVTFKLPSNNEELTLVR